MLETAAFFYSAAQSDTGNKCIEEKYSFHSIHILVFHAVLVFHIAVSWAVSKAAWPAGLCFFETPPTRELERDF